MHIVLQAGHYPRRSGSTGAPGEQNYSVAVCAAAKGMCERGGHLVKVIGADDYVPKSDMFIAVHYDGSTNKRARGASVGYRTGRSTTAASKAAAHDWKREYARCGFEGGYRPDNYTAALQGYYGTGRAHAAGTPVAFILEGGFGSHPEEGPWLRSQAGINTCARAIAAMVGVGTTADPGDEEYTMKRNHPDRAQVTVAQWRINQFLHEGHHDPRSDNQDFGLVVDGQFGPNTESYVKHVQGKLRYATTGEWDPYTAMRVQEILIQRGVFNPRN